jgi:hypothetical protein
MDLETLCLQRLVAMLSPVKRRRLMRMVKGKRRPKAAL